MKNIKFAALSVLAIPLLAACGERVHVDPNEFGYEINASGISKKEFKPGAHRLSWCSPFMPCPKFLTLQVSRDSYSGNIGTVFLPKSNVDLVNVEYGVQFRVRDNSEDRLLIVRESSSTRITARQNEIDTANLADKFLVRVVPETIIDSLKEYTVDQTLTDVKTIGLKVRDEVNAYLRSQEIPLEVTELSFPNGIGSVPSQVIEAKRNLYAVGEQKERDLQAIRAELDIEDQRQAFQLVRIRNDIKNANAAGITYEEYVKLKVSERQVDAMERISQAASKAADSGQTFSVGILQTGAN